MGLIKIQVSKQMKKWNRDWYKLFFREGSLSCFLRSLFFLPSLFLLHSKVQSLLWKPMNLVRLMATLEKWSVHRMFYKLSGLGFSLTIVRRQAKETWLFFYICPSLGKKSVVFDEIGAHFFSWCFAIKAEVHLKSRKRASFHYSFFSGYLFQGKHFRWVFRLIFLLFWYTR